MSLIGLNTTPAERMRGCRFAESFFSPEKVTENGATPTGSPFVNRGLYLDGSTQYATYALAGGEFDSANISIVLEFYPDFDYDLNSAVYLLDSSAANRYNVSKLGNAGSNAIVIYLNGVFVASIPDTTYSSYWLVGQKNVLVVSGTTGNTNAWLNGNQILSSDPSAWTPGAPTSCYVGARNLGDLFFDGIITKIQVYHALLTEQEAIDLYQNDTYEYRDNLTLDLPCDDRFDNPTAAKAEDSTFNENDATLGDGVTASLKPVKNSGRRGYTFDGVDDYLSGITAPTGNFTVTVMKRVSGVISITQENNLTTWNTLFSSGGFTGELLTLRVHPTILTDTQLLDEQFLLKERLNVHGLPSGFLSQAISEGALVMYHDYRSGSFRDWSENSNDGTPSAFAVWNTRNLTFPVPGASVTVPDSSELQLTEGSIVVLADFNAASGNEYLVSKEDVGGVNYSFYLGSGPSQLLFYDGGFPRNIAYDPTGDDYLAVNFASGEACEGFANALSLGAFSGVSTITADDADITIGSYYSGSGPFPNPCGAVLIFNRKLTETEHRRCYSELYSDAWATEVTSRLVTDISNYVEPDDPTNLLSLNMQVVAGNVPDLSAYARTVSGATGGLVRSTQLGYTMDFNGVDQYLDCGTPYALNDVTVSMWVRPTDVSVNAFLFNYYANLTDAWGIRTSAASGIHIYDDIDDANVIRYGTSWSANQWYHVVAVMDGLENKLYLNGELVGSGSSSSDNWASFAGTAYVGFRYPTSQPFKGDIAQTQVFSEAKDADWVAEQYAHGAGALWQTNGAAQESIANETTGNLSNTPFSIGSGTWKISDDEIEGEAVKVFDCVAAGFLSVPTAIFRESPTEAAHGGFDWYMNKLGASQISIVFVAGAAAVFNDVTQNGYCILALSDESIRLRKITAGAQVNLAFTAAGVMPVGAWSRFNVTRSASGVFTVYLNDTLLDVTGGGGSNPVTDTSHTTSDYVVIEMDAGDKFAFADKSGNFALVKNLVSGE